MKMCFMAAKSQIFKCERERESLSAPNAMTANDGECHRTERGTELRHKKVYSLRLLLCRVVLCRVWRQFPRLPTYNLTDFCFIIVVVVFAFVLVVLWQLAPPGFDPRNTSSFAFTISAGSNDESIPGGQFN